jgi:chemotaxis methyl-accepting protein methylase
MLIHAALKGKPGDWSPLVFGTDLNEESLREARHGIYGRDKLESTKLGVLEEYFVPHGDRYEVSPAIRNAVRFSRDDLAAADRLCPAESVFGGFDLVLCRNVIIYFKRELQEAVLGKLRRCLEPGGYLVLGSAEFLCEASAERFRVVDARNRIFQKI